MLIINQVSAGAKSQRCLKYWIIATVLLLIVTACGPGDPITPDAFCSESTDQLQEVRDQLIIIATTANTLNNLNAITVTVALKRESDILADLAFDVSELSTNITVPEEDQETISVFADSFDEWTSEMWTDARVMARAMEDYATDQDANHLSDFVQRLKWFQQELDVAEVAALGVCAYVKENAG